MCCCGYEFQFLSVRAHSRLPSWSPIPKLYGPIPPSPLGYNINIFGIICVVEHTSPATTQHIFQSIHPFKIPLVVAWMVSPSWEVCVGCPCAHLLAAFVWVRGYNCLQGDMICSSSGQPLLYHTASHHLTQSTKEIFMRPAAVPSFQLRYQGLHPINVLDARPRSLQDSTSSKAHHHIISSSIRITLKRTPHSSEDEQGTPCAHSPQIWHPLNCTHKVKTLCGTCQSKVNRSITSFTFHLICSICVSCNSITEADYYSDISEASYSTQWCSVAEAMKLINQFDGGKKELQEFIENMDLAFELIPPSQHKIYY